jgi:NAD(P)-dependent dehydrogenase (short-subunit alcohol dehydrogenase family)
VICADRDASSPKSRSAGEESTDKLIASRGGKSLFVATDVTKAASVQQLVRAAADTFGRVDV